MHKLPRPNRPDIESHARRTRRRHLAIFLAATVLIALVTASCSSSGAVDSAIEVAQGLHSESGVDSEPEEGSEPSEVGSPAWCAPARTVDTLHTQFHAGGDVFPEDAEVQRLLEAADELEAIAPAGDLATNATTFHEGVIASAEAGSFATFGEDPYRSAATAIFAAVEAGC